MVKDSSLGARKGKQHFHFLNTSIPSKNQVGNWQHISKTGTSAGK